MTLLGHDVSEYQAVQDFGGDFTIVRLSEGTGYVDPSGQAHIANALVHGHEVGGYHYAVTGDPTGQARLFAAQLPAHRPFLPFVDIEGAAAQPHNDPPAFALAFLTELERSKHLVGGVYINLDRFRAFDWSPVYRAGFHLWLAEWNATRDATPGWSPILWQNGDGGGRLDSDVFYGGRDTWQALGSPVGGKAPKPVPKPRHAPVSTYTVRSGDTLTAIAARFHTTVGRLVAENRIPNPNLIRVGEQLRITGAPVSAEVFDVIRAGDTLTSIAARNHTTVSTLVRLNRIANPNLIYTDRKLRVK